MSTGSTGSGFGRQLVGDHLELTGRASRPAGQWFDEEAARRRRVRPVRRGDRMRDVDPVGRRQAVDAGCGRRGLSTAVKPGWVPLKVGGAVGIDGREGAGVAGRALRSLRAPGSGRPFRPGVALGARRAFGPGRAFGAFRPGRALQGRDRQLRQLGRFDARPFDLRPGDRRVLQLLRADAVRPQWPAATAAPPPSTRNRHRLEITLA